MTRTTEPTETEQTTTDYYDHDDDGRTAAILNALFNAFGYNQRQYCLSTSFTSVEADEVLQEAGVVDGDQWDGFFTWWRKTGREYIVQMGMHGNESAYRFNAVAFEQNDTEVMHR